MSGIFSLFPFPSPVFVFAIVIVIFYAFKIVIFQHLKHLSEKTSTDVDDFLLNIFRSIGWPVATVIALVVALLVAGFPIFEKMYIGALVVGTATYQMSKFVGVIFTYVQEKIGKARGVAPIQGLQTIIYILVWLVGALSIISVFGYNVNSILAGLGIGGIAVALAVQNILGDIFSSFSIYFDQPFRVGDYIQVGKVEGTVENIGLKSTRMRSLRGEQVVLSNRDLTNQVIQNFGLLKRRRVVQELGFTYETKNVTLEQFERDIPELVNSAGNTEFQRCYFKSFGDSALIFELSYFVNSHDFEEFAALQNKINLALKDYGEKNNLAFAYPTQTVYMNK